mmetsp:Transcript_21123/g.31264  ORF Transcript_21123/g.31264 Transcript_21123/m.31264 type:complete len:104 (+) Transcript_21123:454-765(+)
MLTTATMSQVIGKRGFSSPILFLRKMKVLPYSSTALASSPKAGGAGCGNVHDKMLPPSEEESNRMFKHTPRPKTVSIIGAPMTYGQPYMGTVSLFPYWRHRKY